MVTCIWSKMVTSIRSKMVTSIRSKMVISIRSKMVTSIWSKMVTSKTLGSFDANILHTRLHPTSWITLARIEIAAVTFATVLIP